MRRSRSSCPLSGMPNCSTAAWRGWRFKILPRGITRFWLPTTRPAPRRGGRSNMGSIAWRRPCVTCRFVTGLTVRRRREPRLAGTRGDHCLYRRRLHSRSRLAQSGSATLRGRGGGRDRTGRRPVSGGPTDYERDAAGLESAEFVTANCFVRRDRPRSSRRIRRAIPGRRGAKIAICISPYRLGPAIVTGSLRGSSTPCARRLGHQPQAAKEKPLQCLAFTKSIRGSIASESGPGRHELLRDLLLLGLAIARGLLRASVACPAAVPARSYLACDGLRRTSRAPRHVAEMAVTSALIPPFRCLAALWALSSVCSFSASGNLQGFRNVPLPNFSRSNGPASATFVARCARSSSADGPPTDHPRSWNSTSLPACR